MFNNKGHQAINNTMHNNNAMNRTGSEGTLIESEDSYSAQSPIGNFSTGNYNHCNYFYYLKNSNDEKHQNLIKRNGKSLQRERAVSLDY